MRLLVFALTLLASFVLHAEQKTYVIYDSKIHRITNVATSGNVVGYDVSQTARLHAEIDKRVNANAVGKSEEEFKRNVALLVKSDPVIKRLMEDVVTSYNYVSLVQKHGITKIPAIIVENEKKSFVVYGMENVSEAVSRINAYRVAKQL